MKNKGLLFLLAVLTINHLQVFAQQISADEAEVVAKTELRYTKGIDVGIVTTHHFDSIGHTLLYEVVTDVGVNVLVSGNKMCIPVDGSTHVGRFTKQ